MIDLQLEDAPLLGKKSNNGDKCGSCNQFVPLMTSGNLINQYNHQNLHNNECDRNKMINTMNNASNKSNIFKKITNIDRNINRDENTLKSSSSAFNLNLLPDINNTSSIVTNTFNIKKMVVDKSLSPKKKINNLNSSQQPIKYLDEFAERQLKNMLNDELEKTVIRPENIMRATKKIYEANDKKSNK